MSKDYAKLKTDIARTTNDLNANPAIPDDRMLVLNKHLNIAFRKEVKRDKAAPPLENRQHKENSLHRKAQTLYRRILGLAPAESLPILFCLTPSQCRNIALATISRATIDSWKGKQLKLDTNGLEKIKQTAKANGFEHDDVFKQLMGSLSANASAATQANGGDLLNPSQTDAEGPEGLRNHTPTARDNDSRRNQLFKHLKERFSAYASTPAQAYDGALSRTPQMDAEGPERLKNHTQTARDNDNGFLTIHELMMRFSAYEDPRAPARLPSSPEDLSGLVYISARVCTLRGIWGEHIAAAVEHAPARDNEPEKSRTELARAKIAYNKSIDAIFDFDICVSSISLEIFSALFPNVPPPSQPGTLDESVRDNAVILYKGACLSGARLLLSQPSYESMEFSQLRAWERSINMIDTTDCITMRVPRSAPSQATMRVRVAGIAGAAIVMEVYKWSE